MNSLFYYIGYLAALVGFAKPEKLPVDLLEKWASLVELSTLRAQKFYLYKQPDGLFKVQWVDPKNADLRMRTEWERWRVQEVAEGVNRAFYVKFQPH